MNKQKQGRGPNGRFLPTTSAEEAKIAELEAQVVQLQISNDWNAAEGVRLAESLRLAEQGRDAALSLIEECRSLMTPYMVDGGKHQPLRALCAASAIAMGRTETLTRENGAIREELQHVNRKLDNSNEDHRAALATIEELSLENTRLEALVTPEEAPLLPLWARITFAGIVLFVVAYFGHRAGFDAAMENAK